MYWTSTGVGVPQPRVLESRASLQEKFMPPNLPSLHGLYFEEFTVGRTLRTPGRTITEGDIVGFAGLSGDFNLIHTDAVYAATTPFGQPVEPEVYMIYAGS